MVGNLGKSAGSHFVFENERLRVIFTALSVSSMDFLPFLSHRGLGFVLTMFAKKFIC